MFKHVWPWSNHGWQWWFQKFWPWFLWPWSTMFWPWSDHSQTMVKSVSMCRKEKNLCFFAQIFWQCIDHDSWSITLEFIRCSGNPLNQKIMWTMLWLINTTYDIYSIWKYIAKTNLFTQEMSHFTKSVIINGSWSKLTMNDPESWILSVWFYYKVVWHIYNPFINPYNAEYSCVTQSTFNTNYLNYYF